MASSFACIHCYHCYHCYHLLKVYFYSFALPMRILMGSPSYASIVPTRSTYTQHLFYIFILPVHTAEINQHNCQVVIPGRTSYGLQRTSSNDNVNVTVESMIITRTLSVCTPSKYINFLTTPLHIIPINVQTQPLYRKLIPLYITTYFNLYSIIYINATHSTRYFILKEHIKRV